MYDSRSIPQHDSVANIYLLRVVVNVAGVWLKVCTPGIPKLDCPAICKVLLCGIAIGCCLHSYWPVMLCSIIGAELCRIGYTTDAVTSPADAPSCRGCMSWIHVQ